MPIAINPQTGETVFLGKDGAWQKAPTAVNPQTKETLAFDGEGWKPLPQTQPQQGDMTGVAPVDVEQPATSFASRFQGFKPIENSAGLERALMATAPIVRGALLPFSKNTRTGESYFDSNAGLLGSIKRAVTLPGEVYSGKVRLPSQDAGVPGSISYEDPGAKEAMGRVGEAAMVATPTSAAGRVGPAIAAKSPIPDIGAVKEAAGLAYKRADDAGVVISKNGYSNLATDIANSVRGAGYHPKIHPKVSGALEEVAANIGEAPTLSQLELTRRIAQSAAKSIDRDERRVARIVVDKIDDFVKDKLPENVIGGDAQTAATAITEARSLWHTASKAEAIQGLIEKAVNKSSQFSGSGYENALRTVFRQFSNKPAAMRTFTKEEQDAIRKVGNGGPISNLMRDLGKFAPTGVVSFVGGAGTGYAAGGLTGAVVVPTAGAIARQAAKMSTSGRAEAVSNLILGTKKQPPAEVVDKQIVKARSLFEGLLKPSSLATSNQTSR